MEEDILGIDLDLLDHDHSSELSSSSDEEEFEEEFEQDFIVVSDDQSGDEEEIQPRFGGYEYEFVDEVSDNQKCPVCLFPMRDAVQTSECGHRLCEDCLYRILSRHAHTDQGIMEEDILGIDLDLLDLDHPSESSSSDEEEFEAEFEQDFIVVSDDQSGDEGEIQPRFGGYEYEFVDEVSDNQKCPVCLLPMRDAVQTKECGHRFCEVCLYGILRNDHPVCPNDRREIQKEGGFFSDKAWARDILCLRVKCKQSAIGCDWIGQLRHVEDHKDECPYEEEECPACNDNIQRRLLETHHSEKCPKRIIECVHCQDEFTFVQQQEHEEIYCRRFPLVCNNNCGHEEIPREEMERHLSAKCPMTEVTCPFAKAGCPFQDKRAHLNDHIEASVDDHLELTWSALEQERHSVKDLKQEVHKVKQDNHRLTESVADCREEIRDLSLAVKNLEMKDIQQEKLIEEMGRKLAREMKSMVNKKLQVKSTRPSEEITRTRSATGYTYDYSSRVTPPAMYTTY